MSKKDNTVLLLVGAAALLLLSNQRRNTAPPVYTNYSQVPHAPPRSNAQAWAQWVAAITQSFGTVATLWQPGGPFYQQPVSPQEAQDIASNFQFGLGTAWP